MKTNIEQHIKSQLSERNLSPSENSWEKLSQMMSEEKTEKKTVRFPKWWTFAVAASVIVLVSVVVVNSFEKENPEIQIVNTKNSVPVKPVSIEPNETNELIPANNPAEEIAVHSEPKQISPTRSMLSQRIPREGTPETENKALIKSEAPINNSITKPEKANNDLLVFLSNEPEQKVIENKTSEEILVAQTKEPETKPEKKKSSYVDSDMLLYSVENNQAISETNSNTRLVLIDFNK